MEFGIHRIFKAGVTELELPYDGAHKVDPVALRLRVEVNALPVGTNVYDLQRDDNFAQSTTIVIPRLSRIIESSIDSERSGYPRNIKEQPLEFAGRLAISGKPFSAAGVLFRSGHRIGWVNINPVHGRE